MKLEKIKKILLSDDNGLATNNSKSDLPLYGWLLFLSIIISVIFVLSNGDIIIAFVFLFILAIVSISIFRLDIGFCFFVSAVLLFDQHLHMSFIPITSHAFYFTNIKQIPYLPSFEAGVLTPMEIHLLGLMTIWALRLAIRKDTQIIPIKIWLPALMFLSWLFVSFFYGQARGGNFLSALWEVRALFYLCLMYFFVPQVIQTKQQISMLIWFIICAIAFKALQGVYRFVILGFQFGGNDTLTNSEDPIFIITLLVLLLSLTIFSVDIKQRRALRYLLPVLILGFYVGQRRATYASLIITMIAFIFILPKDKGIKLLKYLCVFMVILVLYLAIFWNSTSESGQLAQKIKSMFYLDPSKMSARDYSSNLYREFENYNLSMTIRHSPFLGIGFGNKYGQWLSFWGLENLGTLSYIPHNSILWLLSKTGSYGFFIFFFFINTFLFYSSILIRKTVDPYLKSISIVSALAIINQLVVVFVEMHLSFYRTMIYLGVLMGLLSTISNLALAMRVSETKVTEERSDHI
jgi:hypothetical protein